MSFSQFTLPITTVNGYLWHTMKQIDPTLQKKYGNVIPFFPISDNASGKKSWENRPYIIYDRMMRISKSPFYPKKNDHILYYLKGNEIDTLEWGMALQYILDRQDDAAQDINSWNRTQENPSNVYFHYVRVYQTDRGDQGSASLTRDFSTRPHYITQFVIDTCYHFTDSIDSILSS